jgi:DNA topoisomerase-2
MVDGLKISLRKILYAAFKRKLTSEIKVAQFSGYVSEHSAYHHGEASLNGAIVNMAQTFVGSNNINLLEPNGQFGTRLHGGDDSASERYIFTLLNKITRSIFPEADDAVLKYLDDDGTLVEPEYYAPIIPFALVNGISGIGTGFSCNIPSYNPKQLIDCLRVKLKGGTYNDEFNPYYEGFTGSIRKVEENKYLVKGVYEKVGTDKIRITELPIGTWSMSYTSFLEGLMDGTTKKGNKIPASIRDFTSVCTEVKVDFEIVFPRGKLEELEAKTEDTMGINGVEKLLKLTTTISSTNMHMFDAERKLHKYESINEIIDDFYKVRIDVYGKRKAYLIDILEKKLVKLSNKARYIQETLEGIIDLRRKKAQVVTELLTERKFDLIDGDYKYLIKMPMDSVTEENVASIMNDRDNAVNELELLRKTSLEKMWLSELDNLEKDYTMYKSYREKIQSGSGNSVKAKNAKKSAPKSSKK